MIEREGDESLRPFFDPKGVAVVGASRNASKLGYGLARNLIQSDYQGAIHLVNPGGGTLFGRPLHADIASVPDPVDLVVLLIPALTIPDALQQCGTRGIPCAIIGSGGFRETGAEGEALEQECLRVARKHGIRLMGPNCIGLLDTHLPIDTTFLPPPGSLPGDVAFISHSGAICAAVIDWARGQGFGLSRLVSLGNQVDVNETDVLAPVASDPYTRVLTMYLEGVSDGGRFVEEAARITREKPIIALKVGRFESGQKAVASHTGALAGQENAFNAAFRRAGVIRAETSEEVFDWARALAWSKLPKGREVAVLTNAGGPGVTAADALEATGMRIANLGEETKAALAGILPMAASVQNPVDMLANASPEQYAGCLQILLDDPNVHSVLAILPPPPIYTAAGVANALIPVIQMAEKPVVMALMGERLIHEAIERLRAARVPEYRFPERAASALKVLAERAEYLARPIQAPITFDDVDRQSVQKILQSHSGAGSGFLSPAEADRILAAYHIPTLQPALAREAEQAVQEAGRLGFPVALKVASADIVHKSDVGGVQLNLGNEDAVREGFERVVKNAREAQPGAKIDGVYVQRMLVGGQEVICGAVRDEQFGALVMFGSGGVEVEGLGDLTFALAPLTSDEVNYLIENTWAGRKLQGFRGMQAANREAVADALARLAQLAVDFTQIKEVEINPMVVTGEGAHALDVRLRVG